MKKNLLVFLILLVGMIVSACATPTPFPYVDHTRPTATNAPKLVPTSTPVAPTAVSPTQVLVTYLEANGFETVAKPKCNGPCSEYWNSNEKMLVVVFANGSLVMVVPASINVNVRGMIGNTLNIVYGPEIDSWVNSRLIKSFKGQDTRIIEGDYILLKSWRDLIDITVVPVK